MTGAETLRGTGRTYRALEALPDGGVYVVHSGALMPYIRDLLVAQGRQPDAIDVVPVALGADVLRGRHRPIAIDHFAYELLIDASDTYRARLTEFTKLARTEQEYGA